MIISTTQFGNVEIQSEDIIRFPEGLLGFNDLKNFVLLDEPGDDIFVWLQSCEDPQVVFPVLEPELFAPEYTPNLNRTDMLALALEAGQKPRVFTIITIPDDATLMTANLKAPVVINTKKRLARQCVLQDNGLAIREPIFLKLQQRVVQNPTLTIKSQTEKADLGLVITSPRPALNEAKSEI